jgi:uncharacterized protein YggE
MRCFLTILGVVGLLTWCTASMGADQSPDIRLDQLRTIQVRGEGTATSPPDMATVQTGVTTTAPQARDALAANNEAMQRIMEVLKENGIAAKDIQTSSFSVQPQYEHDREGRMKPKITGYRVTNQVEVHVRNLANLGKVLDALVQAGSNQISGIQFGIDDPTGVMDQARNRAVADARNRANLYAQAAGVRLGKVLMISEQPIQMPRPQYRALAFAAERRDASVPVATGEQELRASIEMLFALEEAD